jgi:hypothetical protein
MWTQVSARASDTSTMAPATHPASLHLHGELSAEAVNAAPRWEWRVFARGVLPLRFEDLPALAAPEAPVQEVYLLSSRSEDTVKVCGRELHIRRLDRAAPGGLELWGQGVKTRFPITGRALQSVCEAWGLPAPAQPRLKYTIAEFEQEFVRHAVLYPVAVTKRRTRLELLRCKGERVELVIGVERWETIAFKDSDPARVRAVVAHLGLGHFANVNYAAALRRIVGFVPDRAQRA